ncbi:MAG: ethanolamine ammonia-lyase reactivating factor EutA [Planctomycetes bacterium]|nr:ethanolamine ammonia-lyase reactivating factor EutA [Planctomycetota bacterium]
MTPIPPDDSSDPRIDLIGLDIGSTTTKAVVAHAEVLRNRFTGRMELGHLHPVHRPDPVFTPFECGRIQERLLRDHLERWLAECEIRQGTPRAGGILITGLASLASNSAVIARVARQRIGQTLVASAEDPALESWLAFMGNGSALSEAHPDRHFLNVDIGGGTTNLALGRCAEVSRLGCLYIGARHFRFAPGTYTLTHVSPFGSAVLHHLSIRRRTGDSLDPEDLRRILDFYTSALEASIAGRSSSFFSPALRCLVPLPYEPPPSVTDPILIFSGGVGELVYRRARGDTLPPTTAYGDLGIDLAERIVASSTLSSHLAAFTPSSLGRATVHGLALHSTEVSGATLYLPRPGILPLGDLPIVSRLSPGSDPESLSAALELARRTPSGACIQFTANCETLHDIRELGGRLAQAIRSAGYPPDLPLVLFIPGDTGKVIGSYATEWGRLSVSLVVLDQISPRPARFATIGKLVNNVATVSFFGM